MYIPAGTGTMSPSRQSYVQGVTILGITQSTGIPRTLATLKMMSGKAAEATMIDAAAGNDDGVSSG